MNSSAGTKPSNLILAQLAPCAKDNYTKRGNLTLIGVLKQSENHQPLLNLSVILVN